MPNQLEMLAGLGVRLSVEMGVLEAWESNMAGTIDVMVDEERLELRMRKEAGRERNTSIIGESRDLGATGCSYP